MYIFDNLNLNKNNIMKLVKQLAHLYFLAIATSCGERNKLNQQKWQTLLLSQ
jgi:hypothetical protein